MRLVPLLCILGSAILLLSINSHAGNTPTTRPADPIPLQEVLDRGIIGKLGVKLGTVVEISGTVVDDGRRAKTNGIEYKVEKVNGQPIEPALIVYCQEDSPGMLPKYSSVETAFHFVGYEACVFDGAFIFNHGQRDDLPADIKFAIDIRQRMPSFRIWFHVLKVK